MNETTNREIIRDGFEAWSAGRGSVFDLLADDAVWTIVGNSAAGTYQSRAEFLDRVIRPFKRTALHSARADGARALRRRRHGNLLRRLSHGARQPPLQQHLHVVLELQDGAVTNASAFFDLIAFDDLWARVDRAEGPCARPRHP